MKKTIIALFFVVAMLMVTVTGCNSETGNGDNGGNGVGASTTACICGKADCDATGEEHKDVSWVEWTATDSLPAAEAGEKYITLTANVVLPKAYALVADQTLGINLNGFTLSLAAEGDGRDRLFDLSTSASETTTLILADGAGTGMLDYTNAQGDKGLGILQANGTVDLFGGAITHISAKPAALGGAGLKMEGGTFNMYGGSFEYGEAEASKEGGGGNIHISAGEFTMYDGKIMNGIVDNSDASKNPRGGNIALIGTGIFNLEGGTIQGGRTTQGAAICAIGSSEINISGGLITGVEKATSGTICLWEEAVFTMTGGEISGNNSGYKGGALLLNGKAAFIMTGGKITGNNSPKNSGAVHAQGQGKLIIGGDAQITGNTAGANLFLNHAKAFVEIDAKGLSADAKIGVAMSTPGVFMQAGATEAIKGSFTADKDGQSVTLDGASLKLG